MVLIILLIILLGIFIYKFTYVPMTYWEKRGFPSITPMPLLGNMWTTICGMESMTDFLIRLYDLQREKIVGIHWFISPALIIKDPELIKEVTIKKFDHFVNRSIYLFNSDNHPVLKKILFSLKDDKWKSMRASLTASFTGNKMRQMQPFIQGNSTKVYNYLMNLIKSNPKGEPVEFDAKDLCGRYASDVITNCAFGVEVNSLENPDNELYKMGRRAVTNVLWRIICINFLPEFIFKLSKFSHFDKKSTQYLLDCFHETVEKRRETGLKRFDMVNLLLEVQKDSIQKSQVDKTIEVITDVDIVAQAYNFFFAGYETTSTQLSYLLLELAINPDVQEKLYQEIIKAEENETVHPEKVTEIKYLDWVIEETGRKWPILGILDRECTKDFPLTINEKQLVIKKGMVVMINVIGVQRDESIYPNPLKFDPERFSDENMKVKSPIGNMNFGIGPRYCIGARLAQLVMKVLLVDLIKNFEFVPTTNTEIPIQFKLEATLPVPCSAILGVRLRASST